MIQVLEAQSDRFRIVMQIGALYASINLKTGQCQTTSGDMWFDSDLDEVVGMIRHERSIRRAA